MSFTDGHGFLKALKLKHVWKDSLLVHIVDYI